MKQVIFIILSALLSLNLLGQGKQIAASTESEPRWINRDVDQYNVIKTYSSSSISMDDARNKAITSLKERVIIATTRYMLNISINGVESDIRQAVENSLFVKNISESSAIETYWEHRYVKRHKLNIFNYYILYNFNEMEMKKIALELNKANSSVNSIIDQL